MSIFARHRLAGIALSAAILLAGEASAAELLLRWVDPTGKVIGERTLTTAEIEAMPQQEFETDTPWADAPQRFTGPRLADIVALGGEDVANAHVVALNDYSADIPAEDWAEHVPILAVRVDGELMKVRDKGPFWVMYPIDSDPGVLGSELYYSRMVWQVKSIDFLVQ
jgi:hypothetical protein